MRALKIIFRILFINDRHESGLSSSFEERLTLDDIQTDAIKQNAVGRKIEETEPIFPNLVNKGAISTSLFEVEHIKPK